LPETVMKTISQIHDVVSVTVASPYNRKT
jgi:hypothetical protein